jgi:hypothetical protein
VIASVWEPSDEERKAIAEGENVRLLVWAIRGTQQPVAIDTTDELLGKPPNE